LVVKIMPFFEFLAEENFSPRILFPGLKFSRKSLMPRVWMAGANKPLVPLSELTMKFQQPCFDMDVPRELRNGSRLGI